MSLIEETWLRAAEVVGSLLVRYSRRRPLTSAWIGLQTSAASMPALFRSIEYELSLKSFRCEWQSRLDPSAVALGSQSTTTNGCDPAGHLGRDPEALQDGIKFRVQSPEEVSERLRILVKLACGGYRQRLV